MSYYRGVTMNNLIKQPILNRLKIVSRQYQTRKQLRNLPSYLLNDIALTTETRRIELKKNRLVTLLINAFRQLIIPMLPQYALSGTSSITRARHNMR
jgi:uncharacterized protein YjiS (DUF1127 family)